LLTGLCSNVLTYTAGNDHRESNNTSQNCQSLDKGHYIIIIIIIIIDIKLPFD